MCCAKVTDLRVSVQDVHGANFGAKGGIEMPPLRRFEEQLRVRLAARYPGLSPDQARGSRLEERIAQAIERQKGRLGKTRMQSLDEARSALRRGPGTQQREFYAR
jgi:hypothetical protein